MCNELFTGGRERHTDDGCGAALSFELFKIGAYAEVAVNFFFFGFC